MRLDLNLYYYEYTYRQLTEITKNVLAVSIVLSSVDTSTIKDNTLRVIVQKTYKGVDKDTQEKIYEELKAVLDGGNVRPDSTALAAAPRVAHSSVAIKKGPPAPQASNALSLLLKQMTIADRFRRAVAKSNGKTWRSVSGPVPVPVEWVARVAQFNVYVTIGTVSPRSLL